MTGGFQLRWLALDADLSGSISLKAWGLPGWVRAVWHPWFRGERDFLLPGKVEVVRCVVVVFFWGGSGKIFCWKKEGIDQNKVDNCLVIICFVLFTTKICGNDLI